MRFVVDANVLFSALIKDSKTAEILLNPSIEFYVPKFIIEEFEKYKDEILLKTHRNEENFSGIIKAFHQILNIFPEKDIVDFMEKAKEILKAAGVEKAEKRSENC